MSQCFRPVKEIWNTHSSCFIEPETLITLLHDLAARVATASDDHAYGDNTAVWFENGNKVLDYIERDQRFSPDSFKESLEELRTTGPDGRPRQPTRQHTEPGCRVAEFHWSTRRTRVLH